MEYGGILMSVGQHGNTVEKVVVKNMHYSFQKFGGERER